jgi:NADH-quinone oxidoreductase subunit N
MSISLSSWLAISPQIILLLAAIILLLFGAYKVKLSWVYTVCFGAIIMASAAVLTAYNRQFPDVGSLSFLQNDAFAVLFFCLFLFVTAITALLAIRYFEMHETLQSEFFALLFFATIGMMTMAASRDLLVMYLGLETMSITTYILAGYLIPDKRSQESALKYFLTGALGSAIFLFGLAYLFGATGSIAFADIAKMAAQLATSTHPHAAYFKIAAVPFHMWVPDVYDGAPTPVTAFMAVGIKAAAFSIFARIVLVSFDTGHTLWLDVLLTGLCAATMLWGNFAALAQRNIKRLLAYSSIAHAGYLLMAVSSRSEWAAPSIIFYLVAYALTNLGAFAVIIIFENIEGKQLDIEQYAGLSSRYPLLSVCLSIFLLSLAGIPPTIGFIGKWFVFGGAIQTGYIHLILLAILGVLTSLLSVYYYLRVIYFMFMLPPTEQTLSANSPFPIEQRLTIILAIAVIILGCFPPIGITDKASLTPLAYQTTLQLREQKPPSHSAPSLSPPIVPEPKPKKPKPPIVPEPKPEKPKPLIVPETKPKKPKPLVEPTSIPTTMPSATIIPTSTRPTTRSTH